MTKEQLSVMTVKELKEIAKENGLKGYSKLRKAELVKLIKNYYTEKKEEKNEQEKKSLISLLTNKTVYSSVVHVSDDGMRRAAKLYIKKDALTLELKEITKEVQNFSKMKMHDSGGILTYGVGFEVGFDLVYNLSLKLFGDGYKIRHKKLLHCSIE